MMGIVDEDVAAAGRSTRIGVLSIGQRERVVITGDTGVAANELII